MENNPHWRIEVRNAPYKHLTVPLSTQVYKWVLGINARGNPAMETGIRSGLIGHLARMQTLPLQ